MKRANAGEEHEDRLSDLPDCILLHVLSHLNTKQVVQTCVLSKRWKDLWKYVPTLQLNSSHFRRVTLFTKFVTKFLSGRDDSTALRSYFFRFGYFKPEILKTIVTYAASHNVQQLRLSLRTSYLDHFPQTIFSCQSLTSLKISLLGRKILFLKSLSLRSLKTLHLRNFGFCSSEDGQAEPFSPCKMLQTLVIKSCTLRTLSKILCISNARVANLVIRHCSFINKIVLSTPNLRSFSFTTYHSPKLVGSHLSFLEQVCIDIWSSRAGSALILNNWLQLFTQVKSMTLSFSTLMVLSKIPDLRKKQSPCFCNLRKVLIGRSNLSKKVKIKAPSPPLFRIVVEYLLRNSPSAQVTVIDY